MPQKSKKQARKSPAVRPVNPPTTETRQAPAVNVATGSFTRSFTSDFNPDYSQTIKDLKRIAVLAGSFFVILIVLAFVLPLIGL